MEISQVPLEDSLAPNDRNQVPIEDSLVQAEDGLVRVEDKRFSRINKHYRLFGF